MVFVLCTSSDDSLFVQSFMKISQRVFELLRRREIMTDGQTDGQTDRQTDRQTYRWTDRRTDKVITIGLRQLCPAGPNYAPFQTLLLHTRITIGKPCQHNV